MMKHFDEATLRKLEQLTLVAQRVRAGALKGDRRSTKRGSSIEFADYRNYTRGDDLRRLDWNIYARLERPFVKLLEEEEDLAVHLLVDTSLSMAWPSKGDENKLAYALRLAGALGHVALSTGDLVTVTLLRSNGNQRWGPNRGQQHSIRLFEFLEQGNGSGTTDLNQSLRDYAIRSRRPGLLLLLSDLLSPGGYEDGIDSLMARGYEVGIIQLLSRDEVEPSSVGDVRLLDIETGAATDITLDASIVSLYRRRLQEWQDGIGAFCARRQVHYIPVVTDLAWDRLVLQTMRARSLLR